MFATPADSEVISLTDQANLFKAVEEDDEKMVKHLVEEKGVKASECLEFPKWQTPVHVAAGNGNLRIVQYLLGKEPAILKISDTYGYTIPYMAVENGHLDIVKYLVENYKIELSRGISRLKGNNLVHAAAQFGHLDILKYFVDEKDGDVNKVNKNKWPPLFWAAANQHHDIVEYLVEKKKVNLTAIDSQKRNILYLCVLNDDLKLIKYILDVRKAELEINWKDEVGDTLAHRAATLNSVSTLKYLIVEKKADVNIPDRFGQTPLHVAVRWNHYQACKYLLKYGADPGIKDKRGIRPMEESSSKALVKLMENIIQKRNRRSVLPSGPISYSMVRWDLPVRRITGYHAVHGDDICSSQFCNNFLLMIRTIVKYKSSRSLVHEYRLLEESIDPLLSNLAHHF